MNDLIIIDKPYSSFSEEIKRIRTNIKFSSIDNVTKVIMTTSSYPGEGKSFISANLAVAFAQNNEKVLIIDCDLRKGRQEKVFGLACQEFEGFSNLLIDKDWEENYKNYIKKTKIKNLSIIPTGPYPSNPSELLATKKCKNIIDKLKKSFDIIILDCPPVLGLNDTLVVSTYADLTLLVVKHKETRLEAVTKAKKSLENVGAKKICAVLNQIETKESSYYSGYYYTSENK